MVDKPLNQYPLFMALTRPPMYMGVTQSYFLFNAISSVVFFIVSMKIIVAMIGFTFFQLLGMMLCWHEPNFFNILMGKFLNLTPNQSYWGCNSYDPS